MSSQDSTPKLPGDWTMRDRAELARVALRPFRSLALALGSEAKESLTGPDLADVGVVVQALVERAEVILGIPDGTF